MKKTLLKIETPELSLVEESKAEKIKKTFEPMVTMLTSFEKSYNDLVVEASERITYELTQKAKRLRIDIGKVRIETGKLKDKQKEYIKLEDKAIMGCHNVLVWAVKEKEDKLKEIEKYFELQEKKRLEALQLERAEKLSLYVEDAHERDLAKFQDDEFDSLLSMKKKEQEERVEAERIAEEERIAKAKKEEEEREIIRKENEKLKREAEERERLAKKEAEKREIQERERRLKEEAERKIREEKERKERAEYEAKLKAEREAKEKIKRELEAKEKREREERELEEARIENELKKGDQEKVKDLISDLEKIKTKYEFESSSNKKMYKEVSLLIDKITNHINKK